MCVYVCLVCECMVCECVCGCECVCVECVCTESPSGVILRQKRDLNDDVSKEEFGESN